MPLQPLDRVWAARRHTAGLVSSNTGRRARHRLARDVGEVALERLQDLHLELQVAGAFVLLLLPDLGAALTGERRKRQHELVPDAALVVQILGLVRHTRAL